MRSIPISLSSRNWQHIFDFYRHYRNINHLYSPNNFNTYLNTIIMFSRGFSSLSELVCGYLKVYQALRWSWYCNYLQQLHITFAACGGFIVCCTIAIDNLITIVYSNRPQFNKLFYYVAFTEILIAWGNFITNWWLLNTSWTRAI